MWVIVYTAIVTFIILKLVGIFIPLRLTDEELEIGDHAIHGNEVYPSDVPTLGGPHAPSWQPDPRAGGRLARTGRTAPDAQAQADDHGRVRRPAASTRSLGGEHDPAAPLPAGSRQLGGPSAAGDLERRTAPAQPSVLASPTGQLTPVPPRPQ